MKDRKPYAFEVRGSGRETVLWCTKDNKPLVFIRGVELLRLLKDVLMCKAHGDDKTARW